MFIFRYPLTQHNSAYYLPCFFDSILVKINTSPTQSNLIQIILISSDSRCNKTQLNGTCEHS